jgi:hypothetical protein
MPAHSRSNKPHRRSTFDSCFSLKALSLHFGCPDVVQNASLCLYVSHLPVFQAVAGLTSLLIPIPLNRPQWGRNHPRVGSKHLDDMQRGQMALDTNFSTLWRACTCRMLNRWQQKWRQKPFGHSKQVSMLGWQNKLGPGTQRMGSPSSSSDCILTG